MARGEPVIGSRYQIRAVTDLDRDGRHELWVAAMETEDGSEWKQLRNALMVVTDGKLTPLGPPWRCPRP